MIRGSCLCGCIRFEIHGDIDRVSHCHCSMCRKAHGAAFATYGRVAKQALRFICGEEAIAEHVSSPGVVRTFCKHCGANLQWLQTSSDDGFSIALGLLDDDPQARPECHIYTASKAPWYELSSVLPSYAADQT